MDVRGTTASSSIQRTRAALVCLYGMLFQSRSSMNGMREIHRDSGAVLTKLQRSRFECEWENRGSGIEAASLMVYTVYDCKVLCLNQCAVSDLYQGRSGGCCYWFMLIPSIHPGIESQAHSG